MSGAYALLGHPVKHSLSPKLHDAINITIGTDNTYEAIDILPEYLEEKVNELILSGIKGFNLTMPHKQIIIPLLKSLDSVSKRIGAVNTVKVIDGKLYGFNTDAEGFSTAVKKETKRNFENENIVILGAGGAARAIAIACIDGKCKKLTICNRTYKKAEELVDFLISSNPGISDNKIVACDVNAARLSVADIIINCTSLGMSPDNISEMPIPAQTVIHEQQLVCDLIYNPRETKLLKFAREKNATVMNGYPMLFWQAIYAWNIWNERQINDNDIEKIKILLKGQIL